MLIEKSHSKKDIIALFRKLGVIIDKEYTKGEIVSNIEFYFKDVKYNDKIKNCTELKDYLKNPSKKQRPTSQQKKEIMFKAKKIIKWAKNDYILDMVTYKSVDEPYDDIMSIYMWGDLPSVRRACRMYNYSNCSHDNVNPIITEEVEEELNNNKIIKQQIIYKLAIRRATKENPIVVTFN